mmetsp:Transcript_1019/g.2596  ORF Transcript_1019/g.2596 Transcript_1019/m.2596 type:complete len:207 (-) Transcript_1019:464-1084(-)
MTKALDLHLCEAFLAIVEAEEAQKAVEAQGGARIQTTERQGLLDDRPLRREPQPGHQLTQLGRRHAGAGAGASVELRPPRRPLLLREARHEAEDIVLVHLVVRCGCIGHSSRLLACDLGKPQVLHELGKVVLEHLGAPEDPEALERRLHRRGLIVCQRLVRRQGEPGTARRLAQDARLRGWRRLMAAAGRLPHGFGGAASGGRASS